MASSNITQLAQRAVVNFLRQDPTLTFLFPDDIHPSLLDEEAVPVPNIIVKCAQAHCSNSSDGTWKARVRVELRESHDDSSADQHHDRAGLLFNLFAQDAIADLLTAAADDFTAHYVTRLEQGWRVDVRLWVSYLDLDIDCAGLVLG